MIIFNAKNLNHAWTQNEVPGTRYGLSDNGWIDTELFEGWLSEHFIQCAVPGRPLLLLLDGHSTHYQPRVVRFAKEHNVIMLCLPPHTTHKSQPLDCGVFGPLKAKWTEVCHHFFQNNPGKVITKFNFNMLFSKAWLKSLTPANIIAGFKTCGIYPYDSTAISVHGGSSHIHSDGISHGSEHGGILLSTESRDDTVLQEECLGNNDTVHDQESVSDIDVDCPVVEQSVVSQYLVSPTDSLSSGRKSFPHAKLLTSTASLSMLEEKERKKQEAVEQKEKRKKEREEKKKLKEENKKLMEEKRKLKKVELQRKAEERAKKSAEKAQMKLQSAKNSMKRKHSSISTADVVMLAEHRPKRSKISRVDTHDDAAIDPSICCTCFASYEDDLAEESGLDWISCACGRRLHEDCVEKIVKDCYGKERACPFCLDIHCEINE